MSTNLRSILFVDDSAELLLMHRIWFEQHNYRVLTAGSPDQAMEIFNSNPPDVVVLDVVFKNTPTDAPDGFDLCQQMHKANPGPILIIITGLPDLDFNHRRGVECGACRVLTKPFMDDQLLDLIERLLRTQKGIAATDRSQWGIWHFTGRELIFFGVNMIVVAVVITFMGILIGSVLSIKDDVSLLKGQAIATDKAVSRLQGKEDAKAEQGEK